MCEKIFHIFIFVQKSIFIFFFVIGDEKLALRIAGSSLGHINIRMDRHQTSSHMSILFAVIQPKLNMMTTVETQYLAASRQNPYYPFERATYFKLSESGLQISFLVSRERNIGEPLNQFCRQSRQVFTYSPVPPSISRHHSRALLNQRLPLKDEYSVKWDSTRVGTCKT